MQLLLFTGVIFFVVLIIESDGTELKCKKRAREAGDVSCNYYCRNAEDNGWDEGHLQDGEICNYHSVDDGVCKDGLCYLKSDQATPPRDETPSEEEPVATTKKPKKKKKSKKN